MNTTESLKTLSENIYNFRKKIGLTQDELAEKLNISYQAVSKWENGQTSPDIIMLPMLAQIFEVNIDTLFGIKSDNFTQTIGTQETEEYNDIVGYMTDAEVLYSETVACTIKTENNVPLLINEYEKMRGEDITDCIQTLGIYDTDILLKLCSRLTSRKLVQIIKTLRLSEFFPMVANKMDKDDIPECIAYLGITNFENIEQYIES
jgi:transcriptional regulator with XRE-family HTH domain